MIGLGRKGNRWEVVLGYNNFLLAISVVLILCYSNRLWCVRGGYVKYTVWRPISNTHENMANIMSTGCGSA